MKIVYDDGSTLECGTIEIEGSTLIADEYYLVDVDEVREISED